MAGLYQGRKKAAGSSRKRSASSKKSGRTKTAKGKSSGSKSRRPARGGQPAARASRAKLWTGLALVASLLALGGMWAMVPDELSVSQRSPAPRHGEAPVSHAHTPRYEETLPPAPATVEEMVMEALAQAGVSPGSVRSGGKRGGVTLMKVRLAPGVNAEALAMDLAASLEEAGARGDWQASPGGGELVVSLGGKATHRLSLSMAPAKAPPESAPQPAPLPARDRPQVVLVVDDIGYRMDAAKRLMDLGVPVTLSILPYTPHATAIAKLAQKRGLEVMVHLPMEPRSYPQISPGPGGLLTGMPPEELKRLTQEALDQVPGAGGVNNHMGSRFTEDAQALAPVMEVLGRNGLFFLDSLTSSHSQAYAQARKSGVVAMKRDIFLDHDPSPRAVRRQLERWLSLARRRGKAVAIGHPHEATLAELERIAPRLKREVEVVAASRLGRKQALAGRRPLVDKAAATP